MQTAEQDNKALMHKHQRERLVQLYSSLNLGIRYDTIEEFNVDSEAEYTA